jgi:16S rRNA (cytosine967-C5)-methyltransferase
LLIGKPQLEAIVQALTIILPARQPADLALRQFFREHKNLGGRDRGLIADTVYAALRRRRYLEHVTPEGTPREMALAALVKVQGVGIGQIESALSPGEKAWLVALKTANADELPFGIRADLPDWVLERLRKGRSEEEILELARSLQQPAPLDLRVNSMKAPRDAVLERFARDDIVAAPTKLAPGGVRLREKPALNKHVLFTEGVVEVQDEGSQLLGLLMEPRRGEMVVDFCAGAGGKTLQMGAAMHSQGRLYAFDVSDQRLANLGPRLKRSGLSNVHPQRIANENDPKVKRLRGKIDRVLVDAPCTGLGTLRRNPDLKWRQTAEGVAELNAKQSAILEAAGSLVKPGGRLVYGTCSLLTEENEEIVAAFLAKHADFKLVSAKEILERSGVHVKGAGEYLHLYPHVHDTDGFFAAVMQRST